MATYWENSCSFGLRYVSWCKCLIVGLVFSHLGFWSGNLFLIAPFPDLCLLVPFYEGEGGGGAGGGSGHRSQRFKTQNHKSQSFQMMISQITDNEFSLSQRFQQCVHCFCTVLTDLHLVTRIITIRIIGMCHFNS